MEMIFDLSREDFFVLLALFLHFFFPKDSSKNIDNSIVFTFHSIIRKSIGQIPLFAILTKSVNNAND